MTQKPLGRATHSFTVQSRLLAPAERVWEHATTLTGINRELSPWMKMTGPGGPELSLSSALSSGQARLGEPMFQSWVLFLRLLPMERMGLTLSEFGPGFRFVEESRMAVMRSWRHERAVLPEADGGCAVRDTITFEARSALLGRVLHVWLQQFFGHRHRKLRRLFHVNPGE